MDIKKKCLTFFTTFSWEFFSNTRRVNRGGNVELRSRHIKYLLFLSDKKISFVDIFYQITHHTLSQISVHREPWFSMRTGSRKDRHDEAYSRFCGSTEILFVPYSGVAMFMGIRAQLEYFWPRIRLDLYFIPSCIHNLSAHMMAILKNSLEGTKNTGPNLQKLKNMHLTLLCGIRLNFVCTIIARSESNSVIIKLFFFNTMPCIMV